MWKNRVKPIPLTLSAFPNQEPIGRPTEVWSDEESASVFLFCIQNIAKPSVFEKDDAFHSSFVTASANLQAKAFQIDRRESVFKCKALVSVIEPSLATTNSIISAVSVSQMIRMLSGDFDSLYNIWLSGDLFGPRLSRTNFEKPSSKCPICSCEFWEIRCNFDTTKFSDVCKTVSVEQASVLQDQFGVYDFEDGNDRFLSQSTVVDGTILFIDSLVDDIKKIVLIYSGEPNEANLIQQSLRVPQVVTPIENDVIFIR